MDLDFRNILNQVFFNATFLKYQIMYIYIYVNIFVINNVLHTQNNTGCEK